MQAHPSISPHGAAAWLDAGALSARIVPTNIRGWLTYSGLLSARMRELFGSGYALHVVREVDTTENNAVLTQLGWDPQPARVREIEIVNGSRRAMFAQTLIPQSTLRSQAWLRELGTKSLGETLAQVSAVRRSELEFQELRAPDPLFARALPEPKHTTSLWARRSVFAVADAPLLVTEVFLPELERWRAC
jgi:chorismate--pyruvate lyase